MLPSRSSHSQKMILKRRGFPLLDWSEARTLRVELPLSAPGKTVSDTVYRDLTGDPFAGLEVNIVLEARP